MRITAAAIAELLLILRRQTKLLLFVVVLVWSAWSGYAEPILKAMQ